MGCLVRDDMPCFYHRRIPAEDLYTAFRQAAMDFRRL